MKGFVVFFLEHYFHFILQNKFKHCLNCLEFVLGDVTTLGLLDAYVF